MTLKELSQLYYLNKEIDMNRRRLDELESRALPSSKKITTTPKSGGVYDRIGDIASEIADLKNIIELKHRQCLYERNRLERYISGIDDSLTRQIFVYRFVNGLDWRQVAACIGGGNSVSGVKMKCIRYIKAQNESCDQCDEYL